MVVVAINAGVTWDSIAQSNNPDGAAMNPAYIPALAALAGSAIGALATFATTWLTQRYQDRTQRASQESTRRERLYGEFIEQASKLFADALTHELDDPSKIVPLYAITSKLRLFASKQTILSADEVGRRIVATYYEPNFDFHDRAEVEQRKFDILQDFTESCRDDLRT